MVLVLAVAVPFSMVVGLGIYSDFQQSIAHTKHSLRTLTTTMVTNTGSKIAAAREMLESIASRPLVRLVDPTNCDDSLKDMLNINPGYANLGYSDLNGVIVCSVVPQPGGKLANVGNAPWFQNFLKKRSFSVGDPFIGPITGKWVSVLSVPIWDDQREMVGAVHLPLDLKTYDPNISTQFLPEKSRHGFLGADGTLIWRNLDPENLIGTRQTGEAVRRALEIRDGELETLTPDGTTRFFSLLPVPQTGWIAFVGVPASTIYAEAKRRAVIATGISLVALVFTILLAIGIWRRIAKPIAALGQAANAVATGNLDVRVPLRGPQEVAAVALGFNAMMESQQRSIDQLRDAQAIAHLGSWEYEFATDRVKWSDELYRIYGVNSETFVPNIENLMTLIHPEDRAAMQEWVAACASGQKPGKLEFRCVWPDGTIRYIEGQGELKLDADGKSRRMYGTGQDITARKNAEQEITLLAYYDSLTQLPNRRLLMDRLQQAMASSARSGRSGALLLLDLDNFKTLNDTLGHDKGDLLLRQVAQRLTRCVREGDTVARLGGDEFVVLFDGLNERTEESVKQAEVLGEKISTELSKPYQLDDHDNHSTVSIGIAIFSGHQFTIEELLKQADLAMYQSKAAGRNALRFFDQKMQVLVTKRAAMEDELRAAIRDRQFFVRYQPQVMGDGRLTGAEVLLRWLHPKRGEISPVEFIPLAEETGLILPIGQWVLETACIQLTKWSRQAGMEHLTLAVNVSAKQLHQVDFVAQVIESFKNTGANPRLLKLELTESLLVTDLENTVAKMTSLKACGLGFSLDDFGTGFSSLSYLKRLPLDQLKIDQGFVRDILTDPDDAAIAKMVIVLAESLGLAVIAEGVELEAQRDFLARHGCHAYQGYLYSHPLSLVEFEAFATRSCSDTGHLPRSAS